METEYTHPDLHSVVHAPGLLLLPEYAGVQPDLGKRVSLYRGQLDLLPALHWYPVIVSDQRPDILPKTREIV